MQEHHERLQAAGGGVGPTVMLCAGCHHSLHRLGEMIAAGKNATAKDVAERAFPDNPRAVRNILRLAALAARDIRAIKEGEADLPDEVLVGIKLPRSVVVKLKLVAFAWNGSRPGLRPYLRDLLVKHAAGFYGSERTFGPEEGELTTHDFS